MKKLVLVVTLFITMFGLTGCGNEKIKDDLNAPAGLKEITGKIYQAETNEDGNIVINKDKITEEVSYYSY